VKQSALPVRFATRPAYTDAARSLPPLATVPSRAGHRILNVGPALEATKRIRDRNRKRCADTRGAQRLQQAKVSLSSKLQGLLTTARPCPRPNWPDFDC
jgi:hypothetical protein